MELRLSCTIPSNYDNIYIDAYCYYAIMAHCWQKFQWPLCPLCWNSPEIIMLRWHCWHADLGHGILGIDNGNIYPWIVGFTLSLYALPWSHMKVNPTRTIDTWWCHQLETFSALLALCAGNSPVFGDFPTQRPVTRSFDVFFDLSLLKRLSKTPAMLVIWDAIAPIMTSL